MTSEEGLNDEIQFHRELSSVFLRPVYWEWLKGHIIIASHFSNFLFVIQRSLRLRQTIKWQITEVPSENKGRMFRIRSVVRKLCHGYRQMDYGIGTESKSVGCISRRMDKEAVVHIHHGILLSHKKEFIWISSNEMKLEPIIQSEVSQKDKDHYSILTHIYGI